MAILHIAAILCVAYAGSSLAVPPYAAVCSNGPDAWCRDLDTAVQCGAVGICLPVWKENGFVCEFCEAFMVSLDSILKDPKTQADVKNDLDMVCELLVFSTLRADCHEAVEEFLPKVFSYLKGLLADPKKACSTLYLCSTDGELALRGTPIPQLKELNVTCKLCKNVVAAVHDTLTDPATKKDIGGYVDAVCKMMTFQPLANKCKRLADKYLPVLFNYIDKNLVPDKVCKALRWCPSKQGIGFACNEMPSCQDLDDPMCHACRTLEKALSLSLLNLVFPAQENLVLADWTPMNSLQKEYSIVDMVSQMVAMVLPLHCLQGPSYWCRSTDTANICNAMEHCTEKVWGSTYP
ncbi:proactivator polypeptide-like 1 [Petromyzon marinus]|uniref:Prosaposin-like n=1 Tax=Petromyzon marinus TaxID=7757 RepID=A0AAJ7TZ85_PETMA|nr:prosaposin-like [Petromyzon marinus]